MKKVLFATVLLAALSGCQATNGSSVDWQQGNQVEIMNSHIELKSAVWINKMPSMNEEDEIKVHLALTLNSPQVLAPELNIEKVVLRQEGNTWEVNEDEYEVRVHNDHAWEIAGKTFQDVDNKEMIDIAILASGQWIVETGVMIDTVY